MDNRVDPTHDRLSSKRKLDDSDDNNSDARSSTSLQFFVRISSGNSIVIHAKNDDLVESVHQQISRMTGIPVDIQRLLYKGKELGFHQTLSDCLIENDVGVQLVGRIRKEHPQVWEIVEELVTAINKACEGELPHMCQTVFSCIVRFVEMIPDEDSDRSLAFHKIFISGGAPKALVKMLLSSFSSSKQCGILAIKHLLGHTCEKRNYYIILVLEFCKLLIRNTHDTKLYSSFRNQLASLLETIGVAHRSRYLNYAKPSVIIREFFPFVSELGHKVCFGLESSINSSQHMDGTLCLDDVHDLSVFLLQLRLAIEDQVGRQLPICLADIPLVEIGSLHVVFVELLDKINECFEHVDTLTDRDPGVVDTNRDTWLKYLDILKDLYSISGLYEGAKERILLVMKSRWAPLKTLIMSSGYSRDHFWILELKDTTDFETRRHLLMSLFPQLDDEDEEMYEMLIDRSDLLPESFEYITRAYPSSLHVGIFMAFKNEEATGPGVLREWFSLVCKAIFNPQNCLFQACPEDKRRFFPVAASNVDQIQLDYFAFCGRVIGLALMHKIQVGIAFERGFFLQLAGKVVSLEDIKDADPCFYTSCKKILEMDADLLDSDALSLTFVTEFEEQGLRKIVDLCPGGMDIAVNSRNREEYVRLLIQQRFVTSITEQVGSFARGFSDMLEDQTLYKDFFQGLELEDLDLMLYGSDRAICVEEWKGHTGYNGYAETDHEISWFWKIVEDMSTEQQRLLLFFWTAVKYLPIEGFCGLGSPLSISKIDSQDRLPSSNTCFYSLSLPCYPSEETMRDRLQIITQEHISCSFGTS